jgi:hypothetical protein
MKNDQQERKTRNTDEKECKKIMKHYEKGKMITKRERKTMKTD